jgi:hypothetical protein
MAWRADNIIAELLDDPIVQMVMQADHVDRRVLAAEWRTLAATLENARPVAAVSRQSAVRGLALSADALPSAYLAVATKAGPAACGACCA